MTINLSTETKLKLINDLLKKPKFFYGTGDNNIVELLDFVFDLKTLPSIDSRYSNAYGDAYQHLVNNDDWELDYTFLTRFDILKRNNIVKLIEYIIRPDFHDSEQYRIDLIDDINSILRNEGLTLETIDYNKNDQPLFSIKKYDASKLYPIGIMKNEIEFYSNYVTNNIESFESNKKNIFILNFRQYSGWNDYSLHSRCDLYYRNYNGDLNNFGELKVISNNENNISEKKEIPYFNFMCVLLPVKFLELDNTFCSLGQSRKFYNELKSYFQGKYKSILFALKDVALFKDFQDNFEKVNYFDNSIIRTDEAERILREMKFELAGRNRADMYKFTYFFKPIFNSSDKPIIPIQFDFEDSSEIPNRICAIIGKNGVGKTQFISQIPKKLAEEDNEFFDDVIPLFSKLIALSYSPFDTFKPSKSGLNVDYIFCSLRDESGGFGEDKSRSIKFGLTRKRIVTIERVNEWREILESFLPEYYINQIFDSNNEIDVERLNVIRKELSSGQRILLETVTNIIAHIRYDSLLLFDEPETHLHLNAIAQLMNTIYNLVNKFKSFCIITTHSPIIIRELLSRNVYVFDRFENELSIRNIGMESFGANLSDITEEIFGNNEIPKHYQDIIRKLKNNGKTIEDIIQSVSSNIPISLNLRLYIQSIFEE